MRSVRRCSRPRIGRGEDQDAPGAYRQPAGPLACLSATLFCHSEYTRAGFERQRCRPHAHGDAVMRARFLCVSALLALFPVLPVHAYRNPERFGASVDVGGGGGKYFTLSRAEGYGCSVCHTQGSPAPVEVRNLPTAGYLAGQTYRITVDWPDDMPSVALNVEMTDAAGAPFGQLVASNPATLTAADLCPQSDQSDPATAAQTLQMDTSARNVLLVAECGQTQTSFDWIAPAVPANGYFSGSIIFSNRDGKLTGDSVFDIVEPITSQAMPQVTNMYQGACSVLEARQRSGLSRAPMPVAAGLIFALFLCLRIRRRRMRSQVVCLRSIAVDLTRGH